MLIHNLPDLHVYLHAMSCAKVTNHWMPLLKLIKKKKKILKLLLNNSCHLNHGIFEKRIHVKIKTEIRTVINTLERFSVPMSNGGSNTSVNVGQLYKAILESCFSPCFFISSVCCDDQDQIRLRSLQACKIIWFHNDYIFTLQLAEFLHLHLSLTIVSN